MNVAAAHLTPEAHQYVRRLLDRRQVGGLRGMSSRVRGSLGRRAWRAESRNPPRLSIVVPVYNVEDYIAECLDSVLNQRFSNFEVIAVDDGSTDGSADVVRSYVTRDHRVRLHQQRNAGLGAARNAGLRLARGEFLAFVDSDDWLPVDAYSPMIAALDHSGSDFVVGTLERDNGRISPRMRSNHAFDRLGVSIADRPMMLADVFAVNKVFRRTFWDQAVRSFLEGVRYEDQEALTRAFLAARAFDVLRHTVYVWRSRPDGSSITQQRHKLEDLSDRVLTKRISTDLIAKHASPTARRAWHLGILPIDMVAYFRHVPGCSDEYWRLLREAVAEFWQEAGYSFTDARVPAQQRQMGWLVAHDRRKELEMLLRFLKDQRGDSLTESARGKGVQPGPESSGAGSPRERPESATAVAGWEARLVGVKWDLERFTLVGFAIVHDVRPAGERAVLTMAVTSSTGERVPLRVHGETAPLPKAFDGGQARQHDVHGFEATLDLRELARQCVADGELDLAFELSHTVGGVRRAGPFTTWLPSVAGTSWQQIALGQDARLTDEGSRLSLRVRPSASPPTVIEAIDRSHALGGLPAN